MNRVETILQTTKPSRLIDQIRKIWPEIQELHRQGLLYRQICDVLPQYYDINIEYKKFLGVCRRIRESHKPLPTVTDVVEQPAVKPGRHDPFEAARKKRELDERGSNIIAGKFQ